MCVILKPSLYMLLLFLVDDVNYLKFILKGKMWNGWSVMLQKLNTDQKI